MVNLSSSFCKRLPGRVNPMNPPSGSVRGEPNLASLSGGRRFWHSCSHNFYAYVFYITVRINIYIHRYSYSYIYKYYMHNFNFLWISFAFACASRYNIYIIFSSTAQDSWTIVEPAGFEVFIQHVMAEKHGWQITLLLFNVANWRITIFNH